MAASKKRVRAATKAAPKAVKARYERVCVHCGHDFGVDGVLPYRACLHWIDGVFLTTCSNECRKALGLTTHRAAELLLLGGRHV